ncbi:hypothetical protein RFI_18095 [Reticulomyxa filosa]|uniref:Uncharacterized protein n=1 Tax=Reticulomyxa filosa TaxID=46433 RepID=X6N1D5_RETFI|nr:hypothetical protein RFI_18095 [Reticulomyxa filosa]|eukprot:ETO19142.1 hypothetical protein RFI_18095 [Reticulomyxa filosa]
MAISKYSGDEIGCIFVDKQKAKMTMLEVKQDEMKLVYHYNLFSSGDYNIFLIDNVIIAYNQQSEVNTGYKLQQQHNNINQFINRPKKESNKKY